MEVIKSVMIDGDTLMAAIAGWFLWKNVRDVASLAGFLTTMFFFLSGAGLIWWR